MADKFTLTKQIRERFSVTVDFSEMLDSGESMVTGSFVESYNRATELQASGIISSFNYGTDYVQAVVESGSEGTYRLNFVGKTNSGSFFEDEVFLIIGDK